ncbi:MAG: penicillin-binding protein 1C [Solirubrobacterales bacterium]
MKRLARILKCLAKATVVLVVAGVIAFILAWYFCPFPIERLQQWSRSPVVLDAKGRTMLSLVGPDEQWRYPVSLAEVSPWLIQATIAAEDQRFRRHSGVDPWAVLRAVGQNLRAGRVVSGASTLDMQICRMMDNRPRTCRAKIVEAFRAMQLNRLLTKEQILEAYLNVAPYGGNMRGAQAASLRYFNKHAKDLSLAEAALLAGLPQSPSRYRPDRNPDAARERQRVVLRRMLEEGVIVESQYADALSCPIAVSKASRVRRAIHAGFLALHRRPTGGRTTIDLDIQDQVERLADEHLATLLAGTDLAVVVIDVQTSAVVAMLGSGDAADPADGQVNGVLAQRSPGSALKPFLYAAAFEMERLNGESVVYDVPITRGGWTPANFDRTHAEEVSAAEALRRSLNVPAILVAEGVGLTRCCGTLEAAGVRLPGDAQRRGGLALAVGGIEVNLLDLTNAYATLARHGVRRQPRLFAEETSESVQVLKPAVCASISDILSSRHRRPATMEDEAEDNFPWFMWKTGTSSGRRDAWAVGHNYRFAVGVWAGQFSGIGRPEYVGVQAAEPLLCRLFDLPQLRASEDPPEPAPIRVTRPLSPPREVARSLEITTPGNDETFVAWGGTAIIQASANHDEGNQWFLNGKLEGGGMTQRLVLAPGVYELRCVDQQGSPSTVRFTVHPAVSTRAQAL